MNKQIELENIGKHTSNTRQFWKTIGKLEVHKERQRRISEEVIKRDGSVITETQGMKNCM